MDNKNKYLSQMIHKKCNNRHANLYYTNKNVNHDKYARDGKKLNKRNKHKSRYRLSRHSTNSNTDLSLVHSQPKKSLKPQIKTLTPNNNKKTYYSQLFYQDCDVIKFRYGEDPKITLKSSECHSIRIKSKLNISFCDARPEHEILWKHYWTKEGFIEDYNNYIDDPDQIEQISNIEQCEITISSGYSHNHFPQRPIYKLYRPNMIPFSRALGCGGRVDRYDDIFIVLTKCIEDIVSKHKQSNFNFDLFKQECKYIQWFFDLKKYHSKYLENKGLLQCLIESKIDKDLAGIIVGYIEYDKIIEINVDGRIFCWCDNKECIDCARKEEFIEFEMPCNGFTIQQYWMGYFCDVNQMNKYIFDNFVI